MTLQIVQRACEKDGNSNRNSCRLRERCPLALVTIVETMRIFYDIALNLALKVLRKATREIYQDLDAVAMVDRVGATKDTGAEVPGAKNEIKRRWMLVLPLLCLGDGSRSCGSSMSVWLIYRGGDSTSVGSAGAADSNLLAQQDSCLEHLLPLRRIKQHRRQVLERCLGVK